ncbi:MAG TPA: glycosyltransferase N-terminal domain-containing protein [Bacteroidales bacterium]|nr:glycosyltransferase N-terminal domain-containing protein [Bacteroidales bacterium]HRZ48915.1 glycosyltransferase N-terminal domain-containing protein [Bacteroidales bacterium]
MFRILYGAVLQLYVLIIRLVSWRNHKAALWIRGRRGLQEKIKSVISADDRVIWFHASSLGEFEQGRPLLEALREQLPDHRFLLTFFSPSGYEVQKNYPKADLVTYLPIDTYRRMRKFVDAVNPEVLFIIKYEFWYNLFDLMRRRHTPVFLVSGIFRPKQHFFRWYGSWFVKNLKAITWFFVQDDVSVNLLAGVDYHNVERVGDTRFDRVAGIASEPFDHPSVPGWAGEDPVIVAGSTWPADEELILRAVQQFPSLKWIIAPHQVHPANIDRLLQYFPPETCRLSELSPAFNGRVVVVDSIGLLSRLYRYARIAYVGGGFGKGIHNIAEAAVYGCPVIFGPNHRQFREALALIDCGGGFTVSDADRLLEVLTPLVTDENRRNEAAQAAGSYIHTGAGATNQILKKVLPYCSR